MQRRFNQNPNTLKRLNEHYEKLEPKDERFNNWMFPFLKPIIPEKGKIVEVGCGYGRDLREVQKYTEAELHGCDFSTTCINKFPQQTNVEKVWVHDICKDLLPEKYDLIICSQTLEHVTDPLNCILNLKGSLNPKGWLFITVPYPGSGLDRGVKLHQWSYSEQFFKMFLNGCVIKPHIPKGAQKPRHMIIIWKL